MEYRVSQLAPNTWVIDLHDGGRWGRTAAFLFRGSRRTALIETGTAHAVPYLLAGLESIGVQSGDVDDVILTHVHLDHAGGAGYLLEHCRHATVYVHPRGQRHLIDPSRLLAGAKAVYGEVFEEACGSMIPIPPERIIACQDGFTLDLGGRLLTMIDTPGHARHHMCIFDHETRFLCSGDVLGVRYSRDYTGWPLPYLAPTTSPTEFDPIAVHASSQRIREMGVSAILHSHFGINFSVKETAMRITRIADQFAALGGVDVAEETIASRLRSWYEADLKSLGYGDVDRSILEHDVWLNAKGIAHYWTKVREARARSS